LIREFKEWNFFLFMQKGGIFKVYKIGRSTKSYPPPHNSDISEMVGEEGRRSTQSNPEASGARSNAHSGLVFNYILHQRALPVAIAFGLSGLNYSPTFSFPEGAKGLDTISSSPSGLRRKLVPFPPAIPVVIQI
jgi:hypothetical protein